MSFKTKLLLLVALAVSLPAIATCIVLGMQLGGQARVLFASSLQGDLDAFSLLIRDHERNLVEGVRRTAADNTLQVTLELEISSQLTAYIEAQRQILSIEFLAAFDREGKLAAVTRSERIAGTQWRLTPAGATAASCGATPAVERQLATCGGVAYFISVFPILRNQAGLGDGSGGRATHLGYLVGGTPVASPMVLSALRERRPGHVLIWVETGLAYSSLAPAQAPDIPSDGVVREIEAGDGAYLGAARSTYIDARRLTLALLAPLAPLRSALFTSVTTVAGIGALVVLVAVLLISFLVNRILRPIGQLREGAVLIGEGNLAHRIVVRTGDELEQLARQFNDMSDKLQASYATLENKVQDRTRELSDSLERQTAISEILKVIGQSKFDAQPVFEILTRSAIRHCRASAALLYQCDGHECRLVKMHGVLSGAHDSARIASVRCDRSTVVGRTFIDARATQIAGMRDWADTTAAEFDDQNEPRNILAVPLMRDGQAIGVFALARDEPGGFSEDNVTLLATFADQAVIAIENVRLLEEVRARTRELAQSRLRRFLAPQVAELVVASEDRETLLESRRREVTVVFCDLRGFTAFAEAAEPEEVMNMLREYHSALGSLIFKFEGTLERFVGDGLLVVFNDPLPFADHAARAVRMALAMRCRMNNLLQKWQRLGHDLGFGIGIAQGYATVGPIGFEGRLDYAVVGSIPNMASRLCDAAAAGQILINQRAFISLEEQIETTRQEDLILKGFQRPVAAYQVSGWRGTLSAEDSDPAI